MFNVFVRAVVFGLGVELGREVYRGIKKIAKLPNDDSREEAQAAENKSDSEPSAEDGVATIMKDEAPPPPAKEQEDQAVEDAQAETSERETAEAEDRTAEDETPGDVEARDEDGEGPDGETGSDELPEDESTPEKSHDL